MFENRRSLKKKSSKETSGTNKNYENYFTKFWWM